MALLTDWFKRLRSAGKSYIEWYKLELYSFLKIIIHKVKIW